MLLRAWVGLLAACGWLAAALLGFLALAISFDVIARNLGILSLSWLLEVTEYVIYGATFLAAPWVLRDGKHVRVDVFLLALPPRLRDRIAFVAECLGLVASAIFAYYASSVFIEACIRGEVVFKELVIPEWWLLAVMPISAAMLIAVFIERAYKQSIVCFDAHEPKPQTIDSETKP